MFQNEGGDWTRFRELGTVREIDFHPDDGDLRGIPYHERMEEAYECTLMALRECQEEGVKYLLVRHGWSTSRRGKTTCRSQVRKLMRGKDATPYIDRERSIQHHSVFVAAIKPKK